MKRIDISKNWIFYKKGTEERQQIHLPHDAMIHEKRSNDCPSGSAGAFFQGGIYCYEKRIEHAEELANQHVEVAFDGVYKDAKVYLNEELLVEHAYGYTPFSVTLDEKLKAGQENILRVEADNSQMPNSRWYTGSGIYRPVSMYISDPAHILHHGIRIQTLEIQPPKIQITVEHTEEEAEIEIEIKDGQKIIGTAQMLGKNASGQIEMELSSAKLWDEEEPNLYCCHVTLKKAGKVVDEAGEKFGIRKLTWDKNGFYINGRSILLRGACIHHDNGILGACSYDVSEERRVQKLKEAGYNAIRSAHNPASEGMLKACDRLGMYVIDETWDVWYSPKSKYDYSGRFMEHYEEDIRSMVARDFNHPSVLMYSIGNEVSEPAEEKGLEMADRLISYFHNLDTSRAVTGGINLMILTKSASGDPVYKEESEDNAENSETQKAPEQKQQSMTSTMFNQITAMVGTGMNNSAVSQEADEIISPILDKLDIAGYNYASGRYPLEGTEHPERIIYGSETFPQDIAKNWNMVKQYPYLIGDFMWTAWDYLGEAGIGAWAYTEDGMGFNKPYPWLLGDVGAMDILGNPNGELFQAQAVWGILDKPMIAVRPLNHSGKEPAKAVWRGTNAIPGWSWKGCEGNSGIVEVYGEGTETELFLNGTPVGRKTIEDYRAEFEITYHTGVLEAVIYDVDGMEKGRNQLVSAKENLQIHLQQEKETAFSGEPVYVDVRIQDEAGNVECNYDQKVKITVTGGTMLGFGSANPRTEEAYDAGEFTTYYGRAQLVLMRDSTGSMEVTAEAENLPETKLCIEVVEKG